MFEAAYARLGSALDDQAKGGEVARTSITRIPELSCVSYG